MTAENVQSFFIVVPPGFEETALFELRAWLPPEPELAPVLLHGGIEIKLPLSVGLALPARLKVPSRILLRLAEFAAKDFPKLFKRVSAVPWSNILSPSAEFEIHVATHRSRLKMKKRLEETARKAILRVLKASVAEDPPSEKCVSGDEARPFQIYLRMDSDICTLSFDLCGEHLRLRGHRIDVLQAPLRENLAAACLWALASISSLSDRPIELIDPMAGSGVFALEALGMNQIIHARRFTWEYMKESRPFSDLAWQGKGVFPEIVKVFLSDNSEKAVLAMQSNSKRAKVEEKIKIGHQDFFAMMPLPVTSGCERWVILNPPYGERLRLQKDRNGWFEHLFLSLEEKFQPDRLAVIVPREVSISPPKNFKNLKSRRFVFSNGGLPVQLVCFAR